MLNIEMPDNPPKYLGMDVLCWVCEHHWQLHDEEGCFSIINKIDVLHRGHKAKLCNCKERVNKVYRDSMKFDGV